MRELRFCMAGSYYYVKWVHYVRGGEFNTVRTHIPYDTLDVDTGYRELYQWLYLKRMSQL